MTDQQTQTQVPYKLKELVKQIAINVAKVEKDCLKLSVEMTQTAGLAKTLERFEQSNQKINQEATKSIDLASSIENLGERITQIEKAILILANR